MEKLRKLLYLLQLEEYQTPRYFSWLKKNNLNQFSENKKKLKFTFRVLMILFISLPLSVFWGGEKVVGLANEVTGFFFRVLEEVLVFLAKIKLKFYPNLVKIVITGSYGKTTFKEKLAFVLEGKYQVLKTPENTNTRIGISLVILKKLKKDHQILIVEAGAYQKGEIRKICELIRPEYGVITVFGLMHLERFGSLENIREAKSELIPFVADRQKLFVPASFHKFIDFDKTIEKIAQSLSLNLPLLRKRIKKFGGVAHRLEEKRINKGLLLLDDSYNSNPLGFERAVKKLAGYRGKQKILVTPGMIELGEKQDELNFEAARKSAKFVDIFVIVGKTNQAALLKGARSAKNKNLKILHLGRKENFGEKLAPYLRPPAVILIENDLPDHYF